MEKLLTVKEAAERAGVSAALVYGWITLGRLDHCRLGMPGRRGCIRIAEADLDAFLQSCKVAGRREASPPPRPRQPKATFKHLQV